MPSGLTGRSILLTGAASGIGAATARELAERHARLALVDTDEVRLQSLLSELGPQHIALHADVSDPQAMRDACARTMAEFGGVDVVIANAGVLGAPTPARDLDTDELRRILEVNVLGVHNTIRPALGAIEQSKGSIVVVASVAALSPTPLLSAYVASKHAVDGYARSLRMEVARAGVHVGLVYLGIVDTPMVDRATSDPFGHAAMHALPGPMSKAIPVTRARDAVLRSIVERSSTTVAPRWLIPVMAMRGLIAPLDRHIHRWPRLGRLLHEG